MVDLTRIGGEWIYFMGISIETKIQDLHHAKAIAVIVIQCRID
jgi:hypothetical protein